MAYQYEPLDLSCGSRKTISEQLSDEPMLEASFNQATISAPRPKRKQVSYPESVKAMVVYQVIVEKKTKAAMSRKYNVPESTIRGWVKTAKALIEAARLNGKLITLTINGYEETDLNASSPPEVPETDSSSATSSPPPAISPPTACEANQADENFNIAEEVACRREPLPNQEYTVSLKAVIKREDKALTRVPRREDTSALQLSTVPLATLLKFMRHMGNNHVFKEVMNN